MKYPLKRRQLLRTALSGAAGMSLAGLWPSRSRAATRLQWLELDRNLALVRGAGGNVVVGSGSDGVFMVDGGRAGHSEALLDAVAEKVGGRPRLLFNTHWHWDQSGSNEALGRAGATIVAHENTRLWLSTEVISKWEGRVYPPLPTAAQPTQTFFYDSETVSFNGDDIEYGYLPQAHTDGDIYVALPRYNICIVGDVVAGRGYPIVDDCSNGWLGGMVSALETLLQKFDAETRFIAATGSVLGRGDLQAQLDMSRTVLERIAGNYYQSRTYAEFLASKPTREFDSLWGDPKRFLDTAYRGVANHLWEVRRLSQRR